jgi:hypothetical protein
MQAAWQRQKALSRPSWSVSCSSRNQGLMPFS